MTIERRVGYQIIGFFTNVAIVIIITGFLFMLTVTFASYTNIAIFLLLAVTAIVIGLILSGIGINFVAGISPWGFTLSEDALIVHQFLKKKVIPLTEIIKVEEAKAVSMISIEKVYMIEHRKGSIIFSIQLYKDASKFIEKLQEKLRAKAETFDPNDLRI